MRRLSSIMVPTGFINFFIQGLFQDLITKSKEFIFSGTHIIVSQILRIFHSHGNKPNCKCN